MFGILFKESITSIKVFLLMLFLLGLCYTSLVTVVSNICFSAQSHGSLIKKNNKIIGSKLIAQKFTKPEYFWARPSAIDYNPLPSGGSNLAPTNLKLKNIVESSSGSGLDPHISKEMAYKQMDRIIIARNLDKIKTIKLRSLIEKNTQKRDFGFLGEEVINVLELNIALDQSFNE